MTTFEINDLLDKFTLSTINHFNASLAGDCKTANREVAKISTYKVESLHKKQEN